jgi:hypothetical protein
VTVLCCSAVVVKMPNMFTNKERADMHFVHGFCNGNGMAAVTEYDYLLRRSPHCKTFENLHRTLRENAFFLRTNEDDVLAVQDDRCGTDTGMEDFAP